MSDADQEDLYDLYRLEHTSIRWVFPQEQCELSISWMRK